MRQETNGLTVFISCSFMLKLNVTVHHEAFRIFPVFIDLLHAGSLPQRKKSFEHLETLGQVSHIAAFDLPGSLVSL